VPADGCSQALSEHPISKTWMDQAGLFRDRDEDARRLRGIAQCTGCCSGKERFGSHDCARSRGRDRGGTAVQVSSALRAWRTVQRSVSRSGSGEKRNHIIRGNPGNGSAEVTSGEEASGELVWFWLGRYTSPPRGEYSALRTARRVGCGRRRDATPIDTPTNAELPRSWNGFPLRDGGIVRPAGASVAHGRHAVWGGCEVVTPSRDTCVCVRPERSADAPARGSDHHRPGWPLRVVDCS